MPKERIPAFSNDEEAAEFWDTHSFADYWDDTEAVDDVTFAPHSLKFVPDQPPAGKPAPGTSAARE